MYIELNKNDTSCDSNSEDTYWRESAAFWMKKYVEAKRELDEYNTLNPKHQSDSTVKLKIVCKKL